MDEIDNGYAFFSLMIILLYIHLFPNVNVLWRSYIILILFIISYTGCSWYNNRSIFTNRDDKFKQYMSTHIFHIFFITLLLLYVGLNNDDTNALNLLTGLLVLAILYHGNNLYTNGMNNVSIGHVFFALVGIYFIKFNEKSELFFNSLVILSGYVGVKHTLGFFELL